MIHGQWYWWKPRHGKMYVTSLFCFSHSVGDKIFGEGYSLCKRSIDRYPNDEEFWPVIPVTIEPATEEEVKEIKYKYILQEHFE